jgi:thiamine pyrophosphate-dependent acetolactate synthase large subunit-like protein
LGANGVHIEEPKELISAIQEGFSTNLPTIIDVPISIGGPLDAS